MYPLFPALSEIISPNISIKMKWEQRKISFFAEHNWYYLELNDLTGDVNNFLWNAMTRGYSLKDPAFSHLL